MRSTHVYAHLRNGRATTSGRGVGARVFEQLPVAVGATIDDRVELEPGLKEELAETEELARLHSDVSRKLAARRRRTVRVLQKKGSGRATSRSCWTCRTSG
ncbi:MAG: hypothetical protein KJO40_00635 [Deltaproteobacteria bacterium]|nr:hypothetical protein [Deltaproteobacteria bacterium]